MLRVLNKNFKENLYKIEEQIMDKARTEYCKLKNSGTIQFEIKLQHR